MFGPLESFNGKPLARNVTIRIERTNRTDKTNRRSSTKGGRMGRAWGSMAEYGWWGNWRIFGS